jgi:rhamnosyltransferase
MKKKLSICAVIVSYEPDESIIRLVDSINKQTDEIVIVDNFSRSDNSKEILKSLEENQIKIIYNNDNYGMAKALNQGVRYALSKQYKWVLTLDQDSEFYPNTYNILLAGYENLKDKDRVMIIAPKPVERVLIKDSTMGLNIRNQGEILWKNAV